MKNSTLLREFAFALIAALALSGNPGFADVPPPPVEAGTRPSARIAGATGDALVAVQIAVGQTSALMSVATASNKGGFVEKSRADLDQVASNLTAWTAFLQAHPEIATLPATASPALSAIGARTSAARISNRGYAPNVRSALSTMEKAVNALQLTPDGGGRDRLVASMDQAVSDMIASIEFVAQTRVVGPVYRTANLPETIITTPPRSPEFVAANFSLRQPELGARNALTLVRDVRGDGAYVSPVSHPALLSELNVIESLANAILADNRQDAEARTKLLQDFLLALEAARYRASQLAGNATESPEAIARSQQLDSALRAIMTN